MTHIIEFENDKIVLSQIQQMVKVSSIKDQSTLSRLLRKGLAFNPMPDYVQAVNPVKEQPSIWEHKISHGGKGEPYEYLTFNSIPSEYTKILAECRSAGFGKEVPQPDGFTYKVISGGLMRRPTKKET